MRAAAVLLLAPVLASAGVRPRHGGELRVVVPSPSASQLELDPARARAPADRVAAWAAHATLVELDTAGQLRPGLLEALPEAEEGGRAWRLRIAPGLRFHDGQPLGAAEVARSLSRLAGPHSDESWMMALIEGAAEVRSGRASDLPGLQVLSDLELRIVLSRPFPELPRMLAALPAAIVHIRSDGAVEGAGPFAPGPRSAASIAFTAFAGFHAGRPFLDRLLVVAGDVRRLPGHGEPSAILRTEPSPGLPQREAAPDEVVLALVSRRLEAAAEPTRRALGGLDRAELTRLVRAPAHPLASLLPGPTPPIAGTSAPASLSGRLPSRLGLMVADGGALRPAAERIQVKLYDRGVRVVLQPVSASTLQARLAAGDFDVALVPVWLPSRSPPLALAQVVAAVAGAERAAEVLARSAGATLGQLSVLAAELEGELRAVPLYQAGRRLATSPQVQGVALREDGGLDLGDAWIMPAEGGR